MIVFDTIEIIDCPKHSNSNILYIQLFSYQLILIPKTYTLTLQISLQLTNIVCRKTMTIFIDNDMNTKKKNLTPLTNKQKNYHHHPIQPSS
ncbi:hypothetical protein DERP_003990 [Dermatophagoides pteronyssinus]|uniref:Uncharacterized protein n=1 Tax=Dermatophagoides pteronyssinus TaxID=6956 RepID=A0ABQ8J7T7_DERPT|nr:hypothetical protein DERP_003990 [Dermatophagoides pteronyssinus]